MGEARRKGSFQERQKAAIKRNKKLLVEHLGGRDDLTDAVLRAGIAPFLEKMSSEGWQARRTRVLNALKDRSKETNLSKAAPIRVQGDEIGWYLFLCEQALEDPFCMDVSQVARAAPFFAGIGERWQHAPHVRGLQRKIGELLGDYKNNPDGLLFEILVALSYAAKGWEVEFLEERPGQKSPDMVVRQEGLEFFIECKRLQRRTSYAEKERDEFLRVWDLAGDELVRNRQWLWLKGNFHVEASELPDDFLRNIFASKLPAPLGESVIYDGPEATIHARHINQVAVKSHISNYWVKTNSATLSQLLGGDWAPLNSSVTILSHIKPAYLVGCDVPALGTYVEEIAWACGFTRDFDNNVSIDNKARDIKHLLVDAVKQVPADKPSIIHISAETLEGADVERRRTEKVFDTIPSFITDKPVVAVRFHRFQSNQTLDKLWEFDETVERFQRDGVNLEGLIPLNVVVPDGTEMKQGSHWEIYS